MRWLLVAAALAAVAVPVGPTDRGWPVALADDDGDDDGGDDDGGDDDGGDDGGDDDGGSGGGGGDDGGGGRGGGNGGGRGDDGGGGRGGDDFGDDGFGDDGRAAAPRGPAALFDALADLFDGDDSAGEVAPREILGFDLTPAQLAALDAQGFVALSSENLGAIGGTLHRLAAPAGLDSAGALAAARRLAPGALFDLNHLYVGAAACAGDCWGATLVQVADARPDACARGAPVAIVDTAVDPGHPALRGATVVRRSFLSSGLTPAPPDHGTAVAALLVGRVGPAPPLAPGARLLAAEAFGMRDGEPRADAAALTRALDWAVAGGARVIGLSLAGGANAIVERAVTVAARRANLLAAAGNDGPRGGPAYPAAYPAVIGVAALDARKRPWRGGSRGDWVELAAPGVDVPSAGRGGGVATWTGASFAVPFAAAAMLRARAETRGDPDAARALLARAAEDIGPPGRDPASGYGLVRAPGARCY